MMKVFMITMRGVTVGEVDSAGLPEFTAAFKNHDFIEIKNPMNAVIIQQPVMSKDHQQVQLVTGEWVTIEQAQAVPSDHIMTKTKTRMTSLDVESMMVRTDTIQLVRELSSDERTEFNKSMMTHQHQNSAGIVTAPAGFNPKLLKNDE